jgi:hypothetical protein
MRLRRKGILFHFEQTATRFALPLLVTSKNGTWRQILSEGGIVLAMEATEFVRAQGMLLSDENGGMILVGPQTS